MDFDLKSLHPLEIKLLLNVSPKEIFTVYQLIDKLSLKLGQCNQAISWLMAKEAITEKSREAKILYTLTELGVQFQEKGLPETRILSLVKEKGPKKFPEIARELELPNETVGSSFGQMSKEGILGMDKEKRVSVKDESKIQKYELIQAILDKAVKEEGSIEQKDLTPEESELIGGISKKRRGSSNSVFKVVERDDVSYQITSYGEKLKKELLDKKITGEEIGEISPEIIASGEWKEIGIRGYNIHTPPTRSQLGRRNSYGEYLEKVKDKFTGLGFEEFDGPLVETEFWNSDALFMPQFHAARDIHDVYYLKDPTHAKNIEQPYLDNVSKTHENGGNTGSRGWRYSFDKNFTRRLILRSQGTALSAKQIPNAKCPGKYFGIARCFRYDQVDATHLSDFYQTEGIVLGNDVNLRNLLGLLKIFAEEFAGAKEVKYVPGYFPFTEPSIEVFVKHPVLGWFELGGSGIFRPEVTEPLGFKGPVLAWGMGIDRMGLLALGLDDLRELFTHDIEKVRARRSSRNA
jgi:phenylalanyl-tRNA synthetase alpha chain